MAPTNSKANYKSYEAQARMVRAIVAAHPDVKWNYKDIAKYFGQSTADGIQFQFRGIKKDAEQLRETYSAGGDVAACLSLPAQGGISAAGTPTKSAAAAAAARTPTGRKRPRVDAPKRASSSEPTDTEHQNWSDHDETPSKRAGRTPRQKSGTPRKAAARANATIATAAHQDGSDLEVLVKEEYTSIFGGDKPAAGTRAGAGASAGGNAFTNHATDPVISSTMCPDSFYDAMADDYGDGEI